jgi:hypothetical protein
MTVAVYLVAVRLPKGMGPVQGGHEVRVSICFGSPTVQLVAVDEDPREEPDAVG